MMRSTGTEAYPGVSSRNHGPFCVPSACVILLTCPDLSEYLPPVRAA
jgi:hypothetical protein